MKRLSDYEWNTSVVKELTFDKFSDKCDYMVLIGKAAKPTQNEVRKLYESLSGNKVETLKSKKDE